MDEKTLVRELRNETRDKNQKKYAEESKRRLQKIVSTKLRTSFIGALDSFERTFGYLWGIDKDSEEPLTKEQDAMLQLWLLTRNRILTLGNNQIRAVEDELEQYTIWWDRYQTNIPIKPYRED